MNDMFDMPTVGQVMTRDPIRVQRSAAFGDVLALFDRHDVHAFSVVDEHGIVYGIVTKLDVLRAFRPDPSIEPAEPAALSGKPVEDFMRRGVVTLEPGDSVLRAADLIVETRLHSLPVVERTAKGPVLVGMVSRGDVLRALRGATAGVA
jgi:CBS domain-containing protein